jgi:hypothetical protein
MTTYTNQSNTRRAARRMIETGEAPAGEFEIHAADGRFEIVWRDPSEPLPAAPASTTEAVETEIAAAAQPEAQPEFAAIETERLIAELQRRGYRATQARRPRAERPAREHRRNKATELVEAASRGIMPQKPIVTSPTNQHYQKRFNKLAELADAGEWDAIAAYEVKGNNTYARDVARYRGRLLAFRNAVAPLAAGAPPAAT